MTGRIAIALAAMMTATFAVADGSASGTSIGIEAERSRLDNGSQPWDSLTLKLSRKFERHTSVEGALVRTRRFGQEDTQAIVTAAMPLAPTVVGSLSVHMSPSHKVLPKYGAQAGLQWDFRKAWLLHGGLRHSRYTETPVNSASVMLEHYFGDFSALAGVHAAHALGQRTSAIELRATWYYADTSSVGLIASTGDEAIQLGAANIGISAVRSIAIVGRHALEAPWSMRWSAHHVRQGSFYTRSGGHVGLQYDF